MISLKNVIGVLIGVFTVYQDKTEINLSLVPKSTLIKLINASLFVVHGHI